MTSEQRLVNQIRDLVKQVGVDNAALAEDLAEQFADQCYAVNERLNKCEEYLKKGMRSEAVHEAQVAPPLLELAATLAFPEMAQWRNLCLDLAIAPFPELRLDVAKRLKDECGAEELLSPLLKQYRRLVHQGSRAEQIQVLRRIHELDADNEVWLDNLAPLETEELELILEATQAALRNEDLAELAVLYEELTDPRRVVAAPADVLEQIQQRLRRERRRQVSDEGERLIAAVDAAVDEQQDASVAGLLAKWDRLQKFDDFHPVADMVAIAQHARQWLETRQREAAAGAQYELAVQDLRRVVHAYNIDLEAIATAEQAARALGRDLPPELEDELGMVRARLAATAQRQHRQRLLVRGGVLVMLAGVVAVAGWLVHRNLQQKQLLAHARSLVENADYESAQTTLAAIKARHARFFAGKPVQHLHQQVTQALRQQEQAHQQFETTFAQLEDVRRHGYDLPRGQIEQYIASAREVALRLEDQKALTSWQMAWQTFGSRRQEQADRTYTDALAKLQRALQQLPDQTELPSQSEALAKLDQQLSELKQLAAQATGVDPEVIAQLEAQLANRRQDLVTAERQQATAAAERRQRLADYPNVLPDVSAYLQNLRQVVERYADAPEAAAFAQVLAQAPLLEDAIALQDFAPQALPLDAAELPNLEKRLQSLGSGTASIWYADLVNCRDDAKRQVLARNMLRDLTAIPWLTYKVFQVKAKDQTHWQTIYYPHEIFSRDETTADGTVVTLYWGRVWKTGPDVDEPWLEHGKWDTEHYNLTINKRRDKNILPTARLAYKLLEEMPPTGALEEFVLSAMLTLARDGSCRALPRAQLVMRLSEIALQLMPQYAAELGAVQELFAEVDLNLLWINEQNPAVITVGKQAERQLAQVPDLRFLAAHLQANRKLLRAALARQLQPVGCCVRAADGSTQPQLQLEGRTAAWVIGVGPSNRRVFVEAVRLSGAGQLVQLQAAAAYLVPGQILFAPRRANPDELANAAAQLSQRTVQWPASWPANACDLDSLR